MTDSGQDLTQPVDRVVGPRTAAKLGKLGVHTVGDLLRHYPRRYERRGELTDLASLRVGDQVTVLAQVVKAEVRRPSSRPKGMFTAVVADGSGAELTLTFFHQVGYHAKEIVPGRRGLFAGEVGLFNGKRQLTHPTYEMFGRDAEDEVAERRAADYADALIPIYPATKDLPTWGIAKCLAVVVDPLDVLDDPLPEEVRREQGLLGLTEAFRGIHRPKEDADWRRARARLVFEEAFVLQVALAQRRHATSELAATPRVAAPGGLLGAFDARLPWPLTDGQRSVGEVISTELARPHPMHRLLQGEVGSGKTVVALRAMLAVVDSGGQAALLAPTEVLAQQHHRSLTAMLGPLAERGLLGGSDLGTRVTLLTGSQGTSARKQALLDVISGEAGIVVGTHALLQESVEFLDLGLVVVDEQHRFGVEQRAALAAKANHPPHVLVMTATPIPRTVAMTVFGDLDVSTLTELPRGRQPITTHVVPADKPHFVDRAWQRIREEVADGHQAYVVCPRIGGDDSEIGTEPEPADEETHVARPPLRAVLELLPELVAGPLAGLRVEMLHGKLPSEVKDDVMRRFAGATIDVLVATTVIEVGVDVPSATVMVVMDADRFGVSQLHQLRGRIGRGDQASLCLLVTEAEEGSPARTRLEQVAATQDGFALSRLDLEHRREGDVLGATQAGRRSSLRLLSVLRDEAVIEQARAAASALVLTDPDLAAHPALLAALQELVADEQAEFLDKS